MEAVVMEVRFQVCATPSRAQRFSDHAAQVISFALPKRVRIAQFRQLSNSEFLRRQWERDNGELTLPAPQTQEIGFRLHDPTARLTVHELESRADSALADLTPPQPPGHNTAECVPWILTLNVAADQNHGSCTADSGFTPTDIPIRKDLAQTTSNTPEFGTALRV